MISAENGINYFADPNELIVDVNLRQLTIKFKISIEPYKNSLPFPLSLLHSVYL